MKVFISWSGSESKQIAHALREWLPDMFEAVTPYMSDEDNGAGVRWSKVIAEELDSSSFGVLCCTPSNLKAPWLNFEAGALSKTVATARVVPLLHNLTPSDLDSPFKEFMAQRADEDGLCKTVKAINDCLPNPREELRLRKLFDLTWPELEAKLKAVEPAGQEPTQAPVRADRELLEEILELLRDQARGGVGDMQPIGVASNRRKQQLAQLAQLVAGSDRSKVFAQLNGELGLLRAEFVFDADPAQKTLDLLMPFDSPEYEQAHARAAVRRAAHELGWEFRIKLVGGPGDQDGARQT